MSIYFPVASCARVPEAQLRDFMVGYRDKLRRDQAFVIRIPCIIPRTLQSWNYSAESRTMFLHIAVHVLYFHGRCLQPLVGLCKAVRTHVDKRFLIYVYLISTQALVAMDAAAAGQAEQAEEMQSSLNAALAAKQAELDEVRPRAICRYCRLCSVRIVLLFFYTVAVAACVP